MTKKDIAKKVIGIGAGLALDALSVINGQDYPKIQKGVNAPTYEYKEDTPTHKVYHFKLNKDLQRAIKSSKKPHLYLTGDPDSYILIDPDTSGYKLHYSKKNFNEFGEGEKQVGLNIKGDEHVNPCDPNGLGSKTNYLVSFYWSPSHGFSEQPTEPASKETSEKNTFINKYNNTTINNNGLNAEDVKRIFDSINTKQKDSGLELRLLLEGSKSFDPTRTPLNNPYWNAEAIAQLRFAKFNNASIWGGIYGKAGFGKENELYSEPVYKETLLDQERQLFTVTEGTKNGNKTISYPMEAGAIVSFDSKTGLARVDFYGGVVQESTKSNNIMETGYDWIVQNGNVAGEKKSYSREADKWETTNEIVPTLGISVNLHPSKNRHLYIGGGGQFVGKTKSKPEYIFVNAKTGVKFGGGKKAK
ncbi:MAG: hypothetical protein NTZ83_04990 [Candidatus Pacearchaeota archaeon]|nr:hypothetical protein [Candidatus Pacearchaeota archaeon]